MTKRERDESIAEFMARHAKRLKAGEDPAKVERDFRFNLGPTFVTVGADGTLSGTQGLDNAWKRTRKMAEVSS